MAICTRLRHVDEIRRQQTPTTPTTRAMLISNNQLRILHAGIIMTDYQAQYIFVQVAKLELIQISEVESGFEQESEFQSREPLSSARDGQTMVQVGHKIFLNERPSTFDSPMAVIIRHPRPTLHVAYLLAEAYLSSIARLFFHSPLFRRAKDQTPESCSHYLFCKRVLHPANSRQ